MTFNKALEAMKAGHKVRRAKWKEGNIVYIDGDDIRWDDEENLCAAMENQKEETK